MTGRRPKPPNLALAELLDGHGISRKRLAYRVNQLATAAGARTAYKHSSVARWVGGETPRDPVPTFIATALGERIGRVVTVDEIGMGASLDAAPAGWDFPRDRSDAIQGVRAHWGGQDGFRLADRFAAAGYARAVTRWLAVPIDAATAGEGGRRCGREDLVDLWDTAEQARLWDSRFGGGDWRLSSVTQCLRDRAVPLLTGSYTEQVGQELFTITAELSRVVAWAAFDSGHSGIAQRHFIQALRLARAGGDVEMGGLHSGNHGPAHHPRRCARSGT